ncbi:MAG: pyruvate dehydrogenase complex E1 component subunit beta [Holosporales bacterium]|jgi:pyruvate dehydrogenase E1 component beta subunit|nr:pyruvate dehydrogenase complex E1 component subunit beta [Holosporales bacterium]
MSKTTSFRLAIRDAIADEMRRDPRIFLIGEEVAQYQGAYKASQDLLKEFGHKRVIDTPIAEYGFAGIGVGAAFAGLRPIVEFMTFNFAMQAIDHIVNSAAKTLYMSGGSINCPIVFRGPNGAPRNVAAQHSQCFASWYAHCPGLKVVAPYTAIEANGLLKAAIRDDNPVVFLEHESLYGKNFEIPDNEILPMPLDRAIVVRGGADVTITAFSISVDQALSVADELQNKHGISAEVINLVSLRPIDKDTIIKSVKKTGRILNIEEGWLECGIGSEIISIVIEDAFDYLDCEPKRVATAGVPMPYSKNLEQLALPDTNQIVNLIKCMCRLN